LWLNRSFPQFSIKILKKNTASTTVLAFILKPLALQVVDFKAVMDNLTGEKKYAKKLKKTIDIYSEKGQNVARCL